MRAFLRREPVSRSVLSLLILLVSVVSTTDLSAQLTQAVKIVAPDRLSVKVYKQPSASSEMLGIALDGDILEMLGTKGAIY